MEVRLISFSARGYDKAAEIAKKLSEDEGAGKSEYYCRPYALKKYVKDDGASPLTCSLDEWTGEGFAQAEALVFVCACGIAVRAIAPYVKHKTEDPAVIVTDELGRYVIPILSGHLGGANRLAEEIAELIGAEAVLTTATDINERFSVDTFAKDNDLYITDMTKAKEISAEVLQGEKIGLLCDYEVEGELPKDLKMASDPLEFDKLIYIGTETCTDKGTMQLVPRMYSIGIGCRKGKSFEEIETFALKSVEDAGLSMRDIADVSSIDIKKDEPGIKALCKKYGLKSRFYTAKELSEVEGEFSSSEFVSEIVGVDNVCERAATKSAGGPLILPKRSQNGVTVAIAEKNKKEMKIRFE